MLDSNKCLKILHLVKLKQFKELVNFYEDKQNMFFHLQRLDIYSDDDVKSCEKLKPYDCVSRC